MRATSKNRETKQKNDFRFYLTYFVWSTNTIALILLLFSLLAPIVNPTTTTLFSYIGLFFPIILFINICYLILWVVFRKWKLACISLIAILICWNPINTYFTFNSKSNDVPNNTIKLLSYNVQVFRWKISKKKEINPIFKYIQDSDADIICLQEYVEGKPASPELFSRKEIRKLLGNYPYYLITPLEGRSTSNYTYGLACFSKYPIVDSEKIILDSNESGSIIYKININGKIVSVVNNHLESNKITRNDKKLYNKFLKEERGMDVIDEVATSIYSRLNIAYKARSGQADTIASAIKKINENEPIIVCGDFNDTPISYTYRTIKGDFIDSFKNTGKGVGVTYHDNNFLFRIDFIMHSKNIKSYNCTVGNQKLSDHYPIWTHLELPD